MQEKKIEGFWLQGNPEKSILEQNPFIKYTDTYTKLVTEFGKELGEKYLWALFMVNDPSCTIMFEQSKGRRHDLVAAHFLKDTNFDWSILKACQDLYFKEFMTRAKRNYSAISNTMDKLNNRMETFDETSNAEVKLIGGLVKNLKDTHATYKLGLEDFITEKKQVEEMLLTKGGLVLGPEEQDHFRDG